MTPNHATAHAAMLPLASRPQAVVVTVAVHQVALLAGCTLVCAEPRRESQATLNCGLVSSKLQRAWQCCFHMYGHMCGRRELDGMQCRKYR